MPSFEWKSSYGAHATSYTNSQNVKDDGGNSVSSPTGNDATLAKVVTAPKASITLSAARSRTTKSPYTGNKADIPRDALITTTGIIIPLIVLFLGWLCYRRYHKKKDQKAEGRSNTALLSTSKSKSNGPFDRKWWKKHGRAIAEQNQTSENPKDGTLQALASAKSSDYFTSNDEDPEAQPANDH